MKRPLAYITAAWLGGDSENAEQAARYCRAVYEAGFSPICPPLYLPLFLNDAVPEEHKSGIDMGRDLLRRSHVLVVCGHTMTEAMKNDIAVAQRLGITATTLEGMHQNKIPRPAENRIIRIGDGAVFLIFLQIRCVAPSMANTAIERKSGANPACKSVRPNSVDSAMLSAVARIIATTHGRTPDKKALTGAYFIRFFSADAIKRIIKNDGNTTPSVATNEPRIPPSVEPIKVAIFTARGPGVDSDTAIKFRNSFSVSQPLESTVSRTSETIP